MDLYAYAQIEKLNEIASANGINVSRLRGYRLMSEESPYSNDDLREILNDVVCDAYVTACEARPLFSLRPVCYEVSRKTEQIKRKYLVYGHENEVGLDGTERQVEVVTGFRWDMIHGKARKNLKFYLKNKLKRYKEQIAMWNKYAGRDDVLYIHARLGGGWKEYMDNQWFLDGCCDGYDPSYCDIYAKITRGS